MFRRRPASKELSAAEIEAILQAGLVARLAYVDRLGRPCIVPITYAYDGSAFYGYSLLGAKIESMSAHPDVCLEVDEVHDSANWSSVVIRGSFRLLSGDAALEAVKRISGRLEAAARRENLVGLAAQTYVEREGGPGLAYEIRVRQKHGRYSGAGLS